MKRNLVLLTVAFALCFAQGLRAQNLTTTDVPRILSYQGHITNADQSVTGRHPITIRLYSDPEGKHKLWEDTYTTDVKDGIFSVLLGSQTALPTTERLDKPIWLGVSISGTDELRPLTQFTTAPYALNVPDKSITKEKLSEELQTLIARPIGGQEKQTWDLANGGSANTSGHNDDFIGGGRRNFIVNNATANRQANVITGGDTNIIINGTYSAFWSTICGGAFNKISSYGAFIGGGMAWDANAVLQPNHLASGRNSFIGGGSYNTSSADYATIVGGELNIASGDHSFIGGGGNTVGYTGNSTTAQYSAIVGGSRNSANGTYSFIGGGDTNRIGISTDTALAKYSVIGGGQDNEILNQFGFIGGGKLNLTESPYSVIVGGEENHIMWDGKYSFVGGGIHNIIFEDCYGAVVSGGHLNVILQGSDYSSISGGEENIIDTNAKYSIIGSGFHNEIEDSSSGILSGNFNYITSGCHSSFIGGGDTNIIATDSPFGVIVGGIGNTMTNSEYSFIGGGNTNNIFIAEYSIIVGGDSNSISNHSEYSLIGGGYKHVINSHSDASFIGGGKTNGIRGNFGTIAGGEGNIIDVSLPAGPSYSFIGGGKGNIDSSAFCLIGSGLSNRIDSNANFSLIGGGRANRIFESSTGTIAGGDSNLIFNSSPMSFIGGGQENTIAAKGSSNTIAGGHCNWIFHNAGTVTYGTLGGGYQNRIWNNTSSFIGGGYINKVENLADYGTIGGGYKNLINYDGNYGTIGGGNWNRIDSSADYSAITGGDWNKIKNDWGSIGGGSYNLINNSGNYATIPGGRENIAVGYGQTVTGVFNRNISSGFSTDSTFLDNTHMNHPLFIVGNGTSTLNRTNAFEVSNNGHSTVFDVNGEAVFPNGTTDPNGRPYIAGSTYQDNVVYAWGDITGSPIVPLINVNGSFGVKQVIRNGAGDYTIVLIGTDPSTGNPANLTKASITANVVQKYDDEVPVCSFIFPSEIITDLQGNNKFRIRIKYRDCSEIDARFMFKVIGRQ